MVERLLFDRVDAKAARPAVARQHETVALARAHEAETALTLMQLAEARTDVALDAPVVEFVPMAGWKRLGRFVHRTRSRPPLVAPSRGIINNIGPCSGGVDVGQAPTSPRLDRLQ